MSIRLRLTLMYSAVLALMLFGFGGALYGIQAASAQARARAGLAEAAGRFSAERDFQPRRIDTPRRPFARPEIFVQTRFPDGTVAQRSTNLDAVILPLSDTGLRTIQGGQPWVETGQLANVHIMTYSAPVRQGDQLVGIVQVARPLTEDDQALATLRTIVLAGGAVGTLLAFILGWLFAGAALRPIHQLTATAQLIGRERDFSRRVEYAGPTDEIGRLATTFNGMLTELQSAHHQTEQALQIQRRFVADASHELRTPLTTIRGNLALLQRDPPISDDDRAAVLADTVDESDRMRRLVLDLLALARADAGRALRHDPIPVAELLEEVCRQARTLEAERTITYIPAPANLAALGDRDALKQVLVILLDNARKFTPPGGQITLGANTTDQQVALYVRDTGAGIPPDMLPHIFERFYRGDSARTGGGAGLGLAIAHGLVEALGGQISVASTPDAGSTFTLTLPRLPAPPLDE